jgi:hypothetical protein
MKHVEKPFLVVASDAITLELDALSEVMMALLEHSCSPEDFSLNLQATEADQHDNPAGIGATKPALDSSDSCSPSPSALGNVRSRNEQNKLDVSCSQRPRLPLRTSCAFVSTGTRSLRQLVPSAHSGAASRWETRSRVQLALAKGPTGSHKDSLFGAEANRTRAPQNQGLRSDGFVARGQSVRSVQIHLRLRCAMELPVTPSDFDVALG